MIARENAQLVGSSISDLRAILDELGVRRTMLVLDRGAARASGVEPGLRDALGPALVGVFDAFTPNPTSDQPLEAARRAIELRCDAFVALGGGSCMDVAKVGALAAGDPTKASQLVRGAPSSGVTPLRIVAIPTTSGTGSDATHFSAIYVEGKKVSVAHEAIRPQGVILDSCLHVAMPGMIAATTGLDALCQATESYWAAGSTAVSRAFASQAQALIVPHLVPSVRTGAREHREAMMRGAHLAGQAINISKTTASHALSYELTTRFGVAHGLAVALTLGHVAAFNAGVDESDCSHPEGVESARARTGEACKAFGVAPADMPERVRAMISELGLPPTLAAVGVTPESLPAMAAAADTVRLSNNPRRLTTPQALQLLQQAF
ncbi:MAG: phosphonoacetaldehyde reductase [Planctomycetota bacterium]|nr:phosphonoacetaldehyde reductase [Planctomycetota bacterium]